MIELFFSAVAAKAPRKQLGASGSAGSSSKTPSKKASYSSGGGGNPLRVCDIPSWQKGMCYDLSICLKNGLLFFKQIASCKAKSPY